MRIGIDARMFGPTVGGGGLGRYVEQLILELQKQDHENRYVLFLKRENVDACQLTSPRFEKRLADVQWYTLAEQIRLPRIIKHARVDLMHFPHWNVPIFSRVPFVVTIHDLILMEEPRSAHVSTRHPLLYGCKRLGYLAALHHALFHSKKIIAVSQTTKAAIQKHFPSIPSEKIKVIYEGVTELSRLPSPVSRLPLPTPYLLHVGNAFPHKNLKTLLRAFSLFHKRRPDVHLVLAGRRDVFLERLERERSEIDIPSDRFHIIPHPDDATLHTLFAHASLYLFPSRGEGFGLPALEAMSHGVPVACARAGSLPEVLSDAAVYFAPDDKDEMARVIEEAMTNETLRHQLLQKGFVQIKKYSWTRMAQETKQVYEDTA
jgi:glycosyltransferase involved in cell wall biosynthesis